MGNVIARRLYAIRSMPGQEVVVELYRPIADGDDFRCTYAIEWPDGREEGHATGVDSLQSLNLALKTLALVIPHSTFAKAGDLYWHTLGDDLGLP